MLNVLTRIKQSIQPTIVCDSLHDIDFQDLRNTGVNLIFFDVDNTIIGLNETHTPIDYITLINHVKSLGIDVMLLSNNSNTQRIQIIASELSVPGISFACKPFIYTTHHILTNYSDISPSQCAIIGDQLFTDVLHGKWLGMSTILVEPITQPKHPIRRTQYMIERAILTIH